MERVPVLKTTLGRLRLIGFAEGTSFLALLGIAMPLKYLAGLPEAVFVVGLIHGLLFILYVAALVHAGKVLKWTNGRVVRGLAASVLPFGPFVFDAWLRSAQADETGKASGAA